MKLINQTLSHDQMSHLRSLGLDTSDASLVKLFFYTYDGSVVDGEGGYVDEYHTGINDTYVEFFEAAGGDYDHSLRDDYCVYSLTDIIEKLPDSIEKDGTEYFLNITKYNGVVSYDSLDKLTLNFTSRKTLLEAAYSMLEWLVKNRFLEEDKK